jgi:hypothetical protein
MLEMRRNLLRVEKIGAAAVRFPVFPSFSRRKKFDPPLGNDDMRKFSVFSRSMPVFFAGPEDDNIPGGNDSLFLFGGHDPFSGDDDQYLIAVMGMKSVSRPFAEIYDVKAEIPAIGHELLFGYIGSREKGVYERDLRDFVYFDDFHLFILNLISLRASRESFHRSFRRRPESGVA